MEESNFTGVGGLRIATRAWQTASGHPRAAVVIVHGYNSHSGRYRWVAEQLTANGYAVRALDLRGHGKSDGERYFVEKFEDYVNDLKTFIAMVKSSLPGLPVYLLGHSAGGVVSCLYTLDHQDEIAGLICESFAFELPAPEFALVVLKGLSHLAPHAHVIKLKNSDFSRDPQVVESMDNDPLMAHEVQPTQTIVAMVRADERLKKGFPQITLPLLILHGTADKAANSSGSRHFYDAAGSSDKTLKLYEGYFHDLLSDSGKEVVLADIVRWMDERVGSQTTDVVEMTNAGEN